MVDLEASAEDTVDRAAALAVVVITVGWLVLAGMALADPDLEGRITDLDLVLEDMVSLR
jgi:hypothetical protein